MSSPPDRRWLCALLVVLAACKSAAPPPAPAGEASGSARPAPIAIPVAPVRTQLLAPRATPQPVAIDEPRIELPRQESFKLLDAGKGSKAQLRYTLAAGTVAATVQTTMSLRHLAGASFSKPTALAAIRDGFAITTSTDRRGELALRALIGESAAPSAEVDAYLAPWRTLLQNRRITVVVDDRGSLGTITFNDDAAGARSARSRDELIQRLLVTIVPLPVEPVGTGASWRVVTILRQGPAYAKQTATYTLSSRSPAGWKLHVKLQRVAEEQHITDPSLPTGTTAELLALFRALEGDIEIDPSHPMIAGGSLAIESRMHVKLQAQGQAATEQIFEDTGNAVFALCPSAPAPTGATAPAPPATTGATPPAPASSPAVAPPAGLAPCPDGFSR